MTTITVTRHAAWSVIVFRAGYEHSLGGFQAALLTAFSRADVENFGKLAQSFPEIAAAFWMNTEDLQEIVRADEQRKADEMVAEIFND